MIVLVDAEDDGANIAPVVAHRRVLPGGVKPARRGTLAQGAWLSWQRGQVIANVASRSQRLSTNERRHALDAGITALLLGGAGQPADAAIGSAAKGDVADGTGLRQCELDSTGEGLWPEGGGQGRDRTADTVIFSHVLYQLSYLATGCAPSFGHRIRIIAHEKMTRSGPESRPGGRKRRRETACTPRAVVATVGCGRLRHVARARRRVARPRPRRRVTPGQDQPGTGRAEQRAGDDVGGVVDADVDPREGDERGRGRPAPTGAAGHTRARPSPRQRRWRRGPTGTTASSAAAAGSPAPPTGLALNGRGRSDDRLDHMVVDAEGDAPAAASPAPAAARCRGRVMAITAAEREPHHGPDPQPRRRDHHRSSDGGVRCR